MSKDTTGGIDCNEFSWPDDSTSSWPRNFDRHCECRWRHRGTGDSSLQLIHVTSNDAAILESHDG